jgi:hypothetical protein
MSDVSEPDPSEQDAPDAEPDQGESGDEGAQPGEVPEPE